MTDERTEMYLKAIGQIEDEGEVATTSSLAGRLGVSMPSVTEMLRRLVARGLAEREPRRPVRLTAEGQRLAGSLVRRHRLWETFLFDSLKMPWDQVHEEACRLEHCTSPVVEERLSAFLSGAERCPHGHAIPREDGRRQEEPAVPLTEFPRPGRARVVRIQRETADDLRRLARLRIAPGRTLAIEAVYPRDRSVSVQVAGHRRRVGHELAKQVMVERAGNRPPGKESAD